MMQLAVSEHLASLVPFGITGSVSQITGMAAIVNGFPVPLGALCRVRRDDGSFLDAEVIGFEGEGTLILPMGDLSGLRRGSKVTLYQSVPTQRVGMKLLGRVLNGRGDFIDSFLAPGLPDRVRLKTSTPPAMNRPRIIKPLGTGVRAIDGFLTIGEGQRLGIFAGSGVGKSTLLGQIARNSTADINVVCLVGERGREVREFLEKSLGPEGLAKSVVVVATSDEPAPLRFRSAFLASTLAEYFRDLGKSVLLMMDSVTRFALAQREIGLAAREPPATRGYPPSVFAWLPKLLERSGRNERGSITGLYTVLVEGDDTNEPISDTVRGILDGHIVLSRKLAHQGHFPSIDILSSISRVMPDLITPEHATAARRLRQLIAEYSRNEDLITIGAYKPGMNPILDIARNHWGRINDFLKQPPDELVKYPEVVSKLLDLMRATNPET